VPTTADILLALATANEVAGVPPKDTAVALVKLVPEIFMVAPAAPKLGVNDVMVGGCRKIKPDSPPEPAAVVTEMLPEVPLPTTAVMVFAFTTVYEVANVPPNFTEVVPVKFAPLMVTTVPTPPVVGLKEEMPGSVDEKTKPARDAVPPGDVTVTLPDAPLPTCAVMVPSSTTVKESAAVLPNLTAVAPVKLAPLMVTVWSVAAVVGVNELINGAAKKVKPARVEVPAGVVTKTLPDAAPLLTTAVMVVVLTTVKEVAAPPPKLTAVAQEKSVPVMVMVVPAAAVVGENDAMAGAGVLYVKPASVAVPPGVTTEMLPEVAHGAMAVMLVAFTTLNEVAAVPLKVTAVVPVKLEPVMVTVAPTAAAVGVNEVIVGAA